MSSRAMAECWGRQFPSKDHFVRLVALAVADGAFPGVRVIDSVTVRRSIAEKVGADEFEVAEALTELERIGVLENCGTGCWMWRDVTGER